MTNKPMGRRVPLNTPTRYKINSAAHHGCRMCGKSCRNYDVMLTPQEVTRLSHGWWRDLVNEIDPLPDDIPLVQLDNSTGQHTLTKRADGRCVFLDHDNLCVIHKEAGLTAKPIACQFFPMVAIQAPDGVHVSLNTGCKRLVDMGEHDELLEQSEAERLLIDVQAVTTLDDAVALTPDTDILYSEFVRWQDELVAALTTPHDDYWQNLRGAAALLLTIPADAPAPDLTWQSVYHSLATILSQRQPQRSTTSHLFETVRAWLPTLTDNNVTLGIAPVSQAGSMFFAALSRQYLEGRQVALHRTARSGWIALLVSIVAAIHAAQFLTVQDSTLDPDHALNESLSNMLDLFFIPAGQLALTEPNQQAFLLALASGL